MAPLSFSIITRLAGVEDGASSATAAPAARTPQEGRAVADRGPGADRHRVAAADAVALQGDGDAIHQDGELGIGQRVVALDEGRMVRALFGVGADQLRQDAKSLARRASTDIKRALRLTPSTPSAV